ncbi:uncharacterized protein LOC135958494 [Calliphora vicina]|uniref:uncharacterized protein LOC135958494 n=1 Tax=Calliphora vicina TaxID=7373 RepID=UPI00325AA5B1
MLSLLEQNPEIARGFFKGDKQDIERFWRRAEEELNSLGPPNKNKTEWKKVWTDQKKYVRQKAGQNLQHKNGTGGGPNREHKFSSTEQSIYDLIGMKTSVEGVDENNFGLESPSKINEIPEIPPETDIL